MTADEIESIRRRYVTTQVADLAAYALYLQEVIETMLAEQKKPPGRPVHDDKGT